MKAILLDTSAIISGYEVSEVDVQHYTVPSVRDEMMRDDLRKLRLESAVERGLIEIVAPSRRYVEEVECVTERMGEAGILSKADTDLLALGVMLKDQGMEPTVVTDDYSVQNMADEMGLGFKGLLTPGIRRRFQWEVYCPGCRRTFDGAVAGSNCNICGTPLKRRPSKKTQLKP